MDQTHQFPEKSPVVLATNDFHFKRQNQKELASPQTSSYRYPRNQHIYRYTSSGEAVGIKFPGSRSTNRGTNHTIGHYSLINYSTSSSSPIGWILSHCINIWSTNEVWIRPICQLPSATIEGLDLPYERPDSRFMSTY